MTLDPLHDASPATPEGLKARILRVATRLFADRGYGATSVREVAEAAGCTKPALYYHFGSKESLWLAALRAETEALDSFGRDDPPEGVRVRDHLVHAIGAFFAYLEAEPTGMRLLMRADLRPEPGQPTFDFTSTRARHQERVRELLELARARGEVRRDLDLMDGVHALTGMVDARLQLWLHGEPLAPDLPERIVSLFFHGVAS
ncbi:MAG TPA: TetR/AcrR family transcriptional regulator [Polyangiaceae bacterium LLY-WYZ-15_(1-7)]|nr:TetR/AcrR family transcriptional regulator [Polyangiaceae bacterium LLY-WYZ-15_(1-7)]